MVTRRPKKQRKPQPERLAFVEHLQELRSRVLWCIPVFIGATIVGYVLHQRILSVLIQPLGQPIFYTNPAGGFDFALKTALFFGLVVSLPVLVYHAIRFVEPALPVAPSRLLVAILFSSGILLLVGMCFAYFVSLPAALYFLGRFATGEVQALISTSEYFSFVTRYMLGFGIVFQLPLIMLTVNAVQRLSIKQLLRNERWVIVVSFVFAAILTPTPDLLNQLILAVPLILLYQVSVLLIWVANRRAV